MNITECSAMSKSWLIRSRLENLCQLPGKQAENTEVGGKEPEKRPKSRQQNTSKSKELFFFSTHGSTKPFPKQSMCEESTSLGWTAKGGKWDRSLY